MGSTYPLENTGCLEKTPYASPGFGLEHPGFQIHNRNLLKRQAAGADPLAPPEMTTRAATRGFTRAEAQVPPTTLEP